MTTQILAKMLFAGVTVLSSAAMAGSLNGPAYIGERSANPEHETYGTVAEVENARPLAFIGPARGIGPVTGDAERDTIAYQPLLGTEANGLWSFRLAHE